MVIKLRKNIEAIPVVLAKARIQVFFNKFYSNLKCNCEKKLYTHHMTAIRFARPIITKQKSLDPRLREDDNVEGHTDA